MARLNIERQQKLEPKRINTAIAQIKALGLEIVECNATNIVFIFKNNRITFYPYSGWHTGKGIKDGRGLNELLIQLKP